jgi:hypothetical protein
MHDDEYFESESPYALLDWSVTHTLTVNGNDAGIGVEDVKGHIWLRLSPAFVLSWQDRLDIELVPRAAMQIGRRKRRTKRAGR